MALRPFAKHQKRKADDDTTPSAADEFAQFFSNDPRPDPPMDETSAAPAEPPAPTVTMSEHSAAGWYPDSQDPGLMRYWDGFHLTGQTMRVDPARPPAAESGQAAATVATPEPTVAPSPSVTELLAPDQPKVPLLGSQLLSSAVESAPVQEQASSPDRPEPSDAQLDVPVASREDGGSPVAPVPTAAPVPPVATAAPAAPVAPGSPVAPADSPAAPSIARMTSPAVPSAPEPEPTESWAERTERAVARAQVAGTPEAWQEAAQAAAVVSEMALTMQVAADVRQSTKQLDKVAEESQRRAEEAEELAAEAQRAVTKTAQAAKEAADAASAAARAATEAKQKAERAAEALPRVAARSEDAARAVAAAKRKVQVLEEIVTKANQANTSEAWHEAHRSAEQAMEQEQRETLTAGS